MKKLLLSVVLALSTLVAGAQEVSVKYQPEVELGYSVGTGTFATGRVNLHTVQGVRVGQYFSAGVGLGLDFYHDLSESCEIFIPITLNVKGHLPVNADVTPFLSLDLGYGIGATEGVSGSGGFTWSPAVGIRYKKVKFELGYTSQRIQEYGIGLDMNAVRFAVGLVF
ncbi:MAG: hypothetical protein JFR39_05535 [Muribaculaceae bacterium]|nr:hypothetical protein [Muribaculaceae bacterium]